MPNAAQCIPPLRVPYSLIGRGTLCARQPIIPTTLWGLNSPALQTLFSACPSHQKTTGANRPGCPFLLISKAIPHNSRLTAQAPLRQLRHGICVAKMLDNVGLRYPHRASGAKAPRTLRPLPLLRFAVSATGGAHLCSIQYYLRFWLGICRTSLAVSALRIMRYCLNAARQRTDFRFHSGAELGFHLTAARVLPAIRKGTGIFCRSLCFMYFPNVLGNTA